VQAPLQHIAAALPLPRYWRDRATLNGGRLSLEAHAAKLRERHQVQAELRAWCEEVLEGQQQQQQQPEVLGAAEQASQGFIIIIMLPIKP
jgi:hypothetical protein